jgi:hypothetical protein
MHDRPLEYRPHPWHGVDPGKRFPEIVRAYIEIVPTDGVKYEIDKHSGYLMVDRPQRFSSFCPTLYGFVPRDGQDRCGFGHLRPGPHSVDDGAARGGAHAPANGGICRRGVSPITLIDGLAGTAIDGRTG